MMAHKFQVGDLLLVLNVPEGCNKYKGCEVRVVDDIVHNYSWITEEQIEWKHIAWALKGGWDFQLLRETPQPVRVDIRSKEEQTAFEQEAVDFANSHMVVEKPRNKYMREIAPGVWVDVYDVLYAFSVTDPCLQHLIKKALATGVRGHKSTREDLIDIRDSAIRAVEHYDKMNQVDETAK
jgi:hypothetical protein